MRTTVLGDCTLVLFPPGMPTPINVGIDVDVHLAGPAKHTPSQGERSRYREVAERVRQTSIRCEGCGERFEELDVYRVHACEVRYR